MFLPIFKKVLIEQITNRMQVFLKNETYRPVDVVRLNEQKLFSFW